LDLMVFGREGGRRMAEYVASLDGVLPELPEDAGRAGVEEVKRLVSGGGTERLGPMMEQMREDMERHCGVFRTEQDLTILTEKLAKYRERWNQVGLEDKNPAYNLDLIEGLELGHMLDCCQAICAGALARQESRGGHYRDDYPERNDAGWHKHTLAYLEPDGSIRLDYKPVRMKPLTAETIELAERVY
jgi:succinate dehydrogenase / fumarate reductase flavoprotein subunit